MKHREYWQKHFLLHRALLARALVLALLLAGCAPVAGPTGVGTAGEAAAPAAQQTVLRLAWWGNEPRHNMYNDLADQYEELHPEIQVVREFAGFGPYWERLATQVAGGNAPDVIHTHPNYLYDYGARGALLDLTPLVESGQIDLSKFSEGIINTGKIEDKIYMITLGNSSAGFHLNTALFEEAGVPVPNNEWTWSEWQQTAIQLTEALGRDVYGMSDSGGDSRIFRVFLFQRGKRFFDGDQLGFEPEDLQAYWQMWEALRAASALPPAALSAEYAGVGHADSMLAKGIVAMQLQSGNQHKLYQEHMDDELALLPGPHSDDPSAPYGYTVDGAYISIAATTQLVDEAADFVNWFINDPDVARQYNAEHGPPGNQELAAMVEQQLVPADQRLSAMMAYISPVAEPQGYQPAGGGEALDAFGRIYGELGFGNLTLEQAVQQFFDEAEFALQ